MNKTLRHLFALTLAVGMSSVLVAGCSSEKPDAAQNADVVTPEPGAAPPGLESSAGGPEAGGGGSPMVSDSAP